MTTLKLYNSLSREKEEFKPLKEDHVRLYACGPTVYDYAHIGNARMAVIFDQLVRVLRHLYPKVTYVSNITDIEDKIIAASAENGEAIEILTRKFERIYNEDLAALGVSAPDIQPRATEHIPEMITQIEQIIDQGHAYAADGHVLFNVPSFDEYGGLSGRSRDDQIAGARVDIAPYKKDAADFVLWKPSTGNQPGWDSPWGYGRPGWHIECSAMAEKHLGLPFDIHGGGADLKFPHHENEIAQSCCAHGSHDLSSFAKTWVHNGFVTVEGEKMSKSLGNFTTVHDLIEKGVKGEVMRFALLSSHYRAPLDWSQKLLDQTKAQLDGFYSLLKHSLSLNPSPSHVREREGAQRKGEGVFQFLEALLDDLNTAGAINELHALAKKLSQHKSGENLDAFLSAANMLGILQEDPDTWLGYKVEGDTQWIEDLLVERTNAKKEKNFKRADEIRDELKAKNIEIEDTPQGPKWRKV
ncbi:MAG: cysteine--tRNA ligase [Micavibrio aeruginosavorus]|uniref:Cysteine--tRNA ligase n=1 Tax=Micavibrio aeruginosavorus TaxID=349221 RepID=A0A2W5FRJ8_9BACT|nr:MAG: cysteine--tRNA ligase [Micavibrio aeruginosavorus]